MHIFWNELKKILTWKILLLLVIVNSILYFLLIEFNITHFPNGRPWLDSYNIGVEMIEEYGTHMDEAEFEDFIKAYEAQVTEADHYLQSRQEFVNADLGSYEKVSNYDWDEVTEEQSALRDKLFHEDKVDIFWELQERGRLLQFHKGKEESMEMYKNRATGQERVRYEALIEQGQYQVYPEVAISNFKDFILSVAITIIFSVVLVVSPIFLKDRLRQLPELQYTMRKGRDLYKTKAMAGLVATFLVITTLLFVYFSAYSLNNTSIFFKVPMHMFIGSDNWYDPTFFQYIAITIGAIYLLGFGFSLLAMAFSSIVPNYIALIGIQIPLIIGIISYGLNIILTNIISIWIPKCVVPISYSVMVVVSIVFLLFLWRRERKRDILLYETPILSSRLIPLGTSAIFELRRALLCI